MEPVTQASGASYYTEDVDILQLAIKQSQVLICPVIVYEDHINGKLKTKIDTDNHPQNKILYRVRFGEVVNDYT